MTESREERGGTLFSEELIRSYVDEDPRFVERPGLAALVDEQLADSGCRFLLLTGEPGSGKTALMAWLASRHPDWPRYFIRRDSQVPLNAGDARSLLLSIGHQLAALHPGLFHPDKLEVVVRQHVGEIARGGRAVAIRIGDLEVSPFYKTALHVEQEADVVAGELAGISIGRMVADERLLELGNLQYLALLGPAAVLLREQPEARIVVLVDALDELRYERGDAESALDWLADCPKLPANVRFLLSCRPDDRLLETLRHRQRDQLREAATDADQSEVEAALGRYASSFAAERKTAEALAANSIRPKVFVAEALTRSEGNFQYLTALVRAVEHALAVPGADEDLQRLLRLDDVPAGLRDLYGFFLARIRRDAGAERVELEGESVWVPAWEGVYQPVLGILSVAREPLTREQIGRLGSTGVGERWLQGALARLGQFLDLDGGRYRLFHATFPEYLAAENTRENHPDDYLAPTEWHRKIAAGAIAAYGKDWLACKDGYVRAHLAGHAAAVGLLDELLTDAPFLLAAEPAHLLRHIGHAGGEDARRAAAVYERVVYDLAAAPVGEAASHLELAARQAGFDRLADSAGRKDVGQRWRARWARWAPVGAYRVIGRHEGPVGGVAVGELDGRAFAVSCGMDGMMRRWDVASGEPLGEPLGGHGDLVMTVAVAELDGRAVALSAGRNGKVRLSDVASGEVLWDSQDGHRGLVISLIVAEADEGPVAVSCGKDGTVRLWDLASGGAIGAPLVGHKGPVTAVADTELQGRSVAVSAGQDGTIRLWDVATATAFGTPLRGTTGLGAMAVVELEGRPVAISAGDLGGKVRLWNLASGASLGEPRSSHGWVTALATGQLDRRPVVVSGSQDGTVRIWDAVAGEPLWESKGGHESRVYAVALRELDGRPVVFSCGWDGTVRIWELAPEETPADPRLSQPGSVRAIAVGDVEGRSVLVSGGRDGTIRLWDFVTGDALGEPLRGHEGGVTALAVAECEGRPLVVSSGRDGKTCRWDVASGEAIGEALYFDPTAGGGVLAVAELDGRLVAASSGADGAIVLWDVASAEALGERLRGQTSGVSALAVGVLDGRPVLVSGGEAGTIRVCDLASRRVVGKAFPAHRRRIGALAVTDNEDRPLAVSGGAEDGKIRVWDLAAQAALGKPLYTEKRRVSAVAVGELDGRTIVVSGGGWDAGTLRFWDLGARREEFAIELRAAITGIALAGAGMVVSTTAGLLGFEVTDAD